MRRTSWPATRLGDALETLQRFYGTIDPPFPTDPFAMVLWENVAYLVDDDRRRAAFEMLVRRVGVTPRAILTAPHELLLEIASSGGMHPARRVEKLLEIARITLDEFGGDLRTALELTRSKAKAALGTYPGIGAPGAEKVLLFCGGLPVLALDSNGLRVLLRLGYGEEKKSYAATYRSAQEAAAAQVGKHQDQLAGAHLLLRRHGQELCKTSAPRCEQCPLSPACRFYQEQR